MLRDHVDHILDDWRRELSQLDPSPIAVIGRLSRISRLLDRRIDEVLDRHGIDQTSFGILAALRRAGPPYRLSPTDLYRSLLLTSGAMTYRIDTLTDAGLVKRSPDPDDRRGMMVSLTSKGRRTVERALVDHLANERTLLAVFAPDEQRRLAETLRRWLVDLEGPHGDRGSTDEASSHSADPPRR